MDLAGLKIKPAEGMIALKFVDDDGDADDTPASSTGEPQAPEGLIAIVVGVGSKVSGVKSGDLALVRSYARDETCVDGVHFCSSYCVIATLSKTK